MDDVAAATASGRPEPGHALRRRGHAGVLHSRSVKVPPFGMSREEMRGELRRIRHPLRIAVVRAKNPFNIGAIIRTAHSFLVSEIVLIGSEPWYERAAMGMHRYERIVELPDEGSFVDYTREHGWRLVAFEREQAGQGLWEASLPEDAVLVFGNENDGLSPVILDAAEHVVSIPMFGINHSYPVVVAAGIAMAEWTRRYYEGGRVITPEDGG